MIDDVRNLSASDADSPTQSDTGPTVRAPWATKSGNLSESEAAEHLSNAMCRPVSPRTLRYWRLHGTGPVFGKAPGSRGVWYKRADLDEFIEITCARDPAA